MADKARALVDAWKVCLTPLSPSCACNNAPQLICMSGSGQPAAEAAAAPPTTAAAAQTVTETVSADAPPADAAVASGNTELPSVQEDVQVPEHAPTSEAVSAPKEE